METKENGKEVIITSARKALEQNELLQSSFENINEFLETEEIPKRITLSIVELIENEDWAELNDRFHTNLAFGTGGMRGRTIGKTITMPKKEEKRKKGDPNLLRSGQTP